MPTVIARRTFLTRLALGVVSTSVLQRRTLRVGIIGLASTPLGQRDMGIALGIDEAKHAASLFGGAIEAVSLSPSTDVKTLTAVVGDDDEVRCETFAERSRREGFIFLNVICGADALRRCLPTTFHVAPSEAMRRDAAAASVHGAPPFVAAWHHTLSRFGADTLNQRFQKRFGQPMGGDAWCGWMGIKILWEACLRSRSDDAATLAAYLHRETTQFDGHKGRPLSFRPWDHQLRQPLYVGVNDRIVETPAAGAADASTRAVLDQLGAPGTKPCG